MSKSNYLAKKHLDETLGATAFSAPATVYAALFSATPDDTGGGTEITGGSYARVAITNNSTNWPNATGTTTATKQNGTEIAFPQATADYPAAVVGWGIYDASTLGNLLYWGNLVGAQLLFTADASTDVITCPGHAFADTNTVRIEQIAGMTLPTGLSQNTTYYVRDTSGDTFKLATSSGGAAINVTASGSGMIGKLTSKTVTNGDTFKFPASSITIIED